MASYRSHQGTGPACVLMILMSLCTTAWSAQYGGGTGTPDDPYQIATAADLINLGETPADYDKCFVLTADIDLDPNLPGCKVFDRAVIAPGTWGSDLPWVPAPFTGVFDGDGHTISHLTIQGDGWGYSCSHLGLFGELDPGAIILNLGLETVEVSGTSWYVGGLAGLNNGSIAGCYCTGTVSGDLWTGGLVGFNGGSITASYSGATVSGDVWVGGLVGVNNRGRIATSYGTGTVTGCVYVGGLAGANPYGSIAASCSSGSVAGGNSVGGLVGAGDYGWITMSYSAGAITGEEYVGGLVGNSVKGSVASSFWDTETSGQALSTGGRGLTTAEMQDISSFLNAGWDFVDEPLNGTCGYWKMSPGRYPQLWYHDIENPVMSEGLGTAEQPYLIRDARDLGTVWLRPMAHYRLEASVDLSGIAWGIAVVPWFGGNFNGNGCVVSNLHIQGASQLGLFGELAPEAELSNLRLEAVDVNGTGNYVGGLAGRNNGSIAASHSTGTVSGSEYIAGLAGYNGGSVATSHSASTVSGMRYVGGLVGFSMGRIAMGYSTGTVSGSEYIAGLAGCNGGSIAASYSASAVSGTRYVGGLAGSNGDSIATSYSEGTVRGDTNVGGLAGTNCGDMTHCYSTAVVNGESSFGGLVGNQSSCRSEHVGVAAGCFWDVQTSGRATSAGGAGKTTAEMQTARTFLDTGWDFVGEAANGTADVWWIDEGKDYPKLRWEAVDDPNLSVNQ